MFTYFILIQDVRLQVTEQLITNVKSISLVVDFLKVIGKKNECVTFELDFTVNGLLRF